MQPKRTRRNDERPDPRAARERPPYPRDHRRSSAWTTDAKISAGVLGALAALCVGLAGWRFLESNYLSRASVASVPVAAPIESAPNRRAPEAVKSAPPAGRGESQRPTPPAPNVLADPASMPARTGVDRLPPRTLGAADASPEQVALPLDVPSSAHTSGEPSFDPVSEAAAYEAPARPSVVEIAPDDSFWLISERAYGTGAYFKALYRYHEASIAEPDRLPVGQTLEIPPAETLRELFPEDVPTEEGASDFAHLRTYRAKPGETALSVAQSELGDAARWTDVFRLNQQAVTSPDGPLTEGCELKLPPAPRTAGASLGRIPPPASAATSRMR